MSPTAKCFLPIIRGGPRHFVKHVLEAFRPEEAMDFFRGIGVDLVLEPTGKYFPTTHSGKTVLEALIREVNRLGIELLTGTKIEAVRKSGKTFLLKSGEGEYAAQRVVLATGGLSLPETGSDGEGLKIAAAFGHTVVPTYPALVPLLTGDEDWKALSGVTLETELSFYRLGKKEASAKGSFLFTHLGFSGPAALDISRHFAVAKPEEKPSISANFIPGRSEESLAALSRKKNTSNRWLKHFLSDEFGLPASFADAFIHKNNLDPTMIFFKLSSADRRKLFHLLRESPLGVTGVVGYRKAEVTAGGVDLKEVRFASMESRIVPGLHFAGEILDVDGRIGGFNFQWAWSSGAVAGRAAALGLPA